MIYLCRPTRKLPTSWFPLEKDNDIFPFLVIAKNKICAKQKLKSFILFFFFTDKQNFMKFEA